MQRNEGDGSVSQLCLIIRSPQYCSCCKQQDKASLAWGLFKSKSANFGYQIRCGEVSWEVKIFKLYIYLHIRIFRVKKVNEEAKIVIDNTFLTPWVIKPLELGVDIVMHSVTKYLNGHSDVIMGALMINDRLLKEKLFKIQKYRGATPSAFDCFLVLRSLATLELR